MTMHKLNRNLTSLLNRKSFWVIVAFLGFGTYSLKLAHSESNGAVGLSKVGCADCHGSISSSTVVKLWTNAPQINAGQTYIFTISVSAVGSAGAGCDISVDKGAKLAVSGSGLQFFNNELTHNSPRIFSGDSAVWTFKYTAPTIPGVAHIYAAGNAVNLDGRANSADHSNTTVLTVNVVAPSNQAVIALSTPPSFQGLLNGDTIVNYYIKNAGTVPLTINKYAFKTDASFRFSDSTIHTIAAGDSQAIRIDFHPTSTSVVKDSLLVYSSDPSQPVAAVFVSGKGVTGRFVLTASKLDFGSVTSTATSFVTIHNPGNAPVVISNIKVTGASAFTILQLKPNTTLPHALNTADTLQVLVQYSPVANGHDSASLVFTYAENGAPARDSAIALVGQHGQASVRMTNDAAFKVLPNPAYDHISIIQDPVDPAVKISIVNEAGIPVFATEARPTIDISALPNGSYFIYSTLKSGLMISRKLVVLH